MENSIEEPQKTKNRSAIRSSIATPGDIPEGMWIRLQKRHLHTHVYCSTIHNSWSIETAKMLHYQWKDYENVVYVYNGILFSHKEEWNLLLASKWMELVSIILNEVTVFFW
jgi:hypothetical protein